MSESRKWQNDPANPAGKIQCKRFNDAWSTLASEHNTFIEKWGVVGADEKESTYYSPFGGGAREDVALAQTGIGDTFKWTVSSGNVNEIITHIEAALAVLKQRRPVQDKRETPEVADARITSQQAATAERERKESEKEAAFISLYGEPERVNIERGKMLIELQLCFDNSDIQSDYFDSHSSLGPPLLLCTVPRQAETERIARLALARYPQLAEVEFKWHTEKYSMGHGNYLESKGHELPEELKAWTDRYRGGSITHAHWEVVFSGAGENCRPYVAKGYPGKIESHWTDPKADAVSTDGIQVSFNAEKSGFEIRFPSKPDGATLTTLKSEGWRWSRFSSCWYHKASEASLYLAATVAALTPERRNELEAAIQGANVCAQDRGMEQACGIA